MSSRLKKSGLKPNKETLRALLDRYCQEGNMEGANSMLKALFQEHRQPKKELPSIEHKPEKSKAPSTPDSDFSSTPSTPPLTSFSQEDPKLTVQTDAPSGSEAMPVVASSGQMGAGQIVVIPATTQDEAPTVMRAVPMVQVFNPQTRSYQVITYNLLNLLICAQFSLLF